MNQDPFSCFDSFIDYNNDKSRLFSALDDDILDVYKFFDDNQETKKGKTRESDASQSYSILNTSSKRRNRSYRGKYAELDEYESIPISESIQKYKSQIDQKARSLDIVCTFFPGKIQVCGEATKVEHLRHFIDGINVGKENLTQTQGKNEAQPSNIDFITYQSPYNNKPLAFPSLDVQYMPNIENLSNKAGQVQERGDTALKLGESQQILFGFDAWLPNPPSFPFGSDKSGNEILQSTTTNMVEENNQQEDSVRELASPASKTEPIQEPFVQKSFKLYNSYKNFNILKSKIAEFNLEYKIMLDEIVIKGPQQSVMFIGWMSNFLTEGSQQLLEDEVNLSTFHRRSKDEITRKADEFRVNYKFGYHSMQLSGSQENIQLLKDYMHQVEVSMKKAEYPKYWNHENTDMYSEFEIDPSSAEYQDITSRLGQLSSRIDFVKLTRIQNNYLMTNYITHISMRKEFRRNNTDRRLLFHGTSASSPSKIYQSFDAGFDIQFSKVTGKYGKGLYFAEDASVSDQYGFKMTNGNKQILVADVFLGNSCKAEGYVRQGIVKPPEGYDSARSRGGYHVIFSNFHSYPLYLLEYAPHIVQLPQIPQYQYSFLRNYPLFSSLPTAQTSQISQTQPISNPQVPPPLQIAQNSQTSQLAAQTPDISYIGVPYMSRRRQRQRHASLSFTSHPSSTTLKRMKKELFDLQADTSLDFFFVQLVDDKDVTKWIICLIGPPNTPYEGGIFKVKLDLPSDYPLSPPVISFETKIYHPSIDNNGNICIGLLNQWTPVFDVRQVLLAIYVILSDPLLEDPLVPEIANQYTNNKKEFISTAALWTKNYAV